MRSSAGTGPGPITDDGCAVELYAALPARDEPDMVAAARRPPATLLELGAGAGRVTHPLIDRGYSVVAVDSSADMLRHILGAETVRSSIEDLSLHRLFDVVLLSSHLVNTADDGQRSRLLATCARHLEPDGVLLMQRHDLDWFAAADESWREKDGLRSRLTDLRRDEPGLLSATVEYHLGDKTWTQTFTARRVDDEQLTEELAAHGLAFDRVLDEAGRWVTAKARH